MPEFYMTFAQKFNQIPEFYIIYARKKLKCRNFTIFAWKTFFLEFWGQLPRLPHLLRLC